MRVLHLHSSFNPGGKELRAVRLMNLFGPRVAHAVVSAQPGAHGAAARSRAQSRFGIDTMVRRYQELYDGLLAGS